jgi:glycosyltransferase involved in cell wall biosynthesis
MRVLLLRRQALGGIATHTSDLAALLPRFGVEARTEDASDWMPQETGPAADRHVSKRLREIARDYDLVHSFGYRCAWACGEALGKKTPWLFTAWDLPKTTHQLLTAQLQKARHGFATAAAITRIWSEEGVSLQVVTPGVQPQPEPLPSRDQARAELGLLSDPPTILGLGRLVPERGFDLLISAMEAVWIDHPSAHLAIVGEGPEAEPLRTLARRSSQPENIRLTGRVRRSRDAMMAADLVVVPSRRAGFSMVAAEAMSIGVPTMLRDVGGLHEMIQADETGYLVRRDEDLGMRIADALSMPLSREGIAEAGKVWALQHLQAEAAAERIAGIYRDVIR